MAIIRVTNVPSTALSDDVITSAKIADGTIAVSDLANDSVTAEKIASNAVTSAKIADSNITTAKIADSNITTAKVADGAITTGHMHSSVPLGTKNLIINGDMRIAQRGTTPTTGGVYLIDRWKQVRVLSSASVEMSQSTDVPTAQGFYNSIKLNVTSAGALSSGNYHRIDQKIEGQNIQHIKWGTASPEKLTLSFWVKSNYTGSFVATLNPATGSTNSISYVINAVDTWEKKTLTFTDTTSTAPLANDNTTQLSLYFYTAVGASTFTETLNNYINITGVQLEVGDTATPFEHRPYDMELARCQRYFCSSFPQGVAPANGVDISIASTFSAYDNTTGWSPQMFFPVSMRVAPTMTAYRDNVAGTDGQWVTFDSGYTSLTSTTLSTSGKTSGFYCNGSRSGAFAAHDSYLLRGNFTADAEL